MTNAPDIPAQHRAAVGPGIDVAKEFARLHIPAVQAAFDPARQPVPVGLAYHAFNVYTSALDLIIAGRFDAALYLPRALADTFALVYATARSTDAAARYVDGELRASEARKWIETHSDLRIVIEAERDAYDHLNAWSHVNWNHHIAALVDISPNSITPIAGARLDEPRARHDIALVSGFEKYVLLALFEDADDVRQAEFMRAVASFNEWSAVVRDEWQQLHAE